MIAFLKRVLLCIVAPMAVTYMAFQAIGCGATLKNIDDFSDPELEATLKKCRKEGREARDAGATSWKAYTAYEECKWDAGLR